MKKLFLTFNDGSSVVYTMKNVDNTDKYFLIHSKLNMKSAVLQQYPKTKHNPIDLLNTKKGA